MPQLDPTWFTSQIFWLALTFVGLYIVLSRVILPPLMDIISKRQDAIASDISTAEQMKADAEKAQADYEKTLREARENALGVISDTLAEHRSHAEAQNKALDATIEKKLHDATARITAHKKKLLVELEPTSAELAALIVEKLTQRAPQSDQVQAALDELTKGNG